MDDSGNYFLDLRRQKGLKIVSGIRGAGKTLHLLKFREMLLSEGVESSRILYLDADSPELRRCSTCEQVINFVENSLPHDGVSYILIREAGSLADAEIVLGTLSALSRCDIYLTLSTRHILTHGLGKYLAGAMSVLEIPPPDLGPLTTEQGQALWYTIFVKDVLSPLRILDACLVSRIAGYLSDHLGDPISLRQVAMAVSPSGRLISPHTSAGYLEALADAHLIEKAIRFDLTEDAPQATRYCYFFTSLELRHAQFGSAPEHEAERINANKAWLQLRRNYGTVYIASGSERSTSSPAARTAKRPIGTWDRVGASASVLTTSSPTDTKGATAASTGGLSPCSFLKKSSSGTKWSRNCGRK